MAQSIPSSVLALSTTLACVSCTSPSTRSQPSASASAAASPAPPRPSAARPEGPLRYIGTIEPPPPPWRIGDTVEVKISLIADDRKDLACVSTEGVDVLRCGFVSIDTKPLNLPDERLLRPYTTVDGSSLLAAGLWSQPALAEDEIPPGRTRFFVSCKYKVQGKFRNPAVRWVAWTGFFDKHGDWPVGTLSDCIRAL